MTPTAVPMTADAMAAFASYMAYEGYDTDLQWFVQVELCA